MVAKAKKQDFRDLKFYSENSILALTFDRS
jgi:hypothetical protein